MQSNFALFSLFLRREDGGGSAPTVLQKTEPKVATCGFSSLEGKGKHKAQHKSGYTSVSQDRGVPHSETLFASPQV